MHTSTTHIPQTYISAHSPPKKNPNEKEYERNFHTLRGNQAIRYIHKLQLLYGYTKLKEIVFFTALQTQEFNPEQSVPVSWVWASLTPVTDTNTEHRVQISSALQPNTNTSQVTNNTKHHWLQIRVRVTILSQPNDRIWMGLYPQNWNYEDTEENDSCVASQLIHLKTSHCLKFHNLALNRTHTELLQNKGFWAQ